MAIGFVKKKLTFLFCDVTSQDHMIERSLVFMGGSFSQPPTKFGVLRHCGSGVMIFLVVEERNSKRSSDSAISIFLEITCHSNTYQNFARRTTFASVSNGKNLILVTCALYNEWWNVRKETFVSPSKTATRRKKRKKY